MKVWIIAYIVVAIIVFVATCVLIEISASDVDRALSTALNKPLIDYKKHCWYQLYGYLHLHT